MINERIFLGYPIEFEDICKIYPPTVDDVVGNKDFGIYQSLFTMTQEELDDAYRPKEESFDISQIRGPMEGVPFAERMKLEQPKQEVIVPTPFKYLLMNYYNDEEVREKIEEAFQVFIHEPVTIVPEIEMLLIGKSEEELDPDVDLENPRLLTEENYFDFQNMIRTAMGESLVEKPDPDEDPNVTRIKRKNREARKRLAREKKAPTFGTLLAAICCMGIGITPLNIGEISYACVHWLVGMYQQNEEYDIDIRALLAGADSKKVKPKYWIKNLDS